MLVRDEMWFWIGSSCGARGAIFVLAFGALGRKSQRAQKGELCATALAKVASLGAGRGSLIFRFFSVRVLRFFIMLGDCWGQKHGFWPRCIGRAPGWSPKREMPVLASQALATDPCPRFFQARPARKLRLTDPRCSSAATTQVSRFTDVVPETAQNGGFRHHFATACVFADVRPSTRRHRPKAPFAREYWLRNVAGTKYQV